MSYPPDHKSKTHARIVEAAAKGFREDGMQATGIDQLMAAAGLTRGGFYAHFPSKAALFSEVLEKSFGEARENLLTKGLEERQGDAWVVGATRRYLAKAHRDAPGGGCAIPTLGAEVARAPELVRDTFGRELEGLLGAIAERSGQGSEAATALLAMWVGALTMARAVNDPKQSNAILDACKAQIARHFLASEEALAAAT